MASGTNTETPRPAPMRPTPGIAAGAGAGARGALMPPGSTAGVGTVPLAGIGMLPGTEGGMTGVAPLGPLRPVLLEGTDPILLMRTYPDAHTGDAARDAAIAAGEARAAAGEHMVASQNEPVVFAGEGVTYDRDRARGEGAHVARPGRNDPPVVGVHPPPQQSTSATRQPDEKHDKK